MTRGVQALSAVLPAFTRKAVLMDAAWYRAACYRKVCFYSCEIRMTEIIASTIPANWMKFIFSFRKIIANARLTTG